MHAPEPGLHMLASRRRRSLAGLDASQRELLQQRQRSPAAYHGVSSVSRVGAGVFAVGSIDLRCSVIVFDDAPRRDAVVLVPSAHYASCRA